MFNLVIIYIYVFTLKKTSFLKLSKKVVINLIALSTVLYKFIKSLYKLENQALTFLNLASPLALAFIIISSYLIN